MDTENTTARNATSPPKVSVIIPCHNSGATVLKAIQSALAQTYKNFELIMVDDGSSDGTAGIISSVSDPRIVLIQQANRGASGARNRGLAEARGEIVAFLDSDDEWSPGFLEKAMALLEAAPQAAMVVANQLWQKHEFDLETNLLDCAGFDRTRSDVTLEDLIRKNVVSTSAVAARADVVRACGGFDEGLKVAEDYHLWLKIAATRKGILLISEPMGFSRRYLGGSLAKNRIDMAKHRLMCLDKFYKEHSSGLTASERKAFKKIRRNSLFVYRYRMLRSSLKNDGAK